MLYVCWMLPLATCCHTRYHLHTFEIWLLSNNKHLTNVWQSNIIPFRISTTLKHCSALTSVKDGTHMCYVHRRIRYLCTYAVHMSAALNGSSALQRFKHGNAVERLNGLMFDFYTWLLQIVQKMELLINLCPLYILALTIVCECPTW